MPSRDGFPTNPEMLADFTETARLLLVETLRATAEGGFPPGLIDKPLPFIHATATHLMDTGVWAIPTSITSETLVVRPVGAEEVAEPVPGSNLYEEPPASIIEQRTRLRRPISEAKIVDGLADFANIVVAGTVHAAYTAYDRHTTERKRTNSWDDEPDQGSIAAGKYLAEEAIEHVRTKGVGFAPYGLRQAEVRENDVYIVALGFEVRADLPLNGHESRPFLHYFMGIMEQSAADAQARIAEFEAVNAPQQLIDKDTELYEKRKAAAQRARAILER